MTKYRCACCGEYTLTKSERFFQECPKCSWIADEVQNDKIDYRGGANTISLREAQEIYKKAIRENLDPKKEIYKADRYAYENWNEEEEKEKLYKLYPERKLRKPPTIK